MIKLSERLYLNLDVKFRNPGLQFAALVGQLYVTVLHVAALFGHLKIIKWYNEDLNYSNINPESENAQVTPMFLAVQEKKLEVERKIK